MAETLTEANHSKRWRNNPYNQYSSQSINRRQGVSRSEDDTIFLLKQEETSKLSNLSLAEYPPTPLKNYFLL